VYRPSNAFTKAKRLFEQLQEKQRKRKIQDIESAKIAESEAEKAWEEMHGDDYLTESELLAQNAELDKMPPLTEADLLAQDKELDEMDSDLY
jgi:hypothetical protein